MTARHFTSALAVLACCIATATVATAHDGGLNAQGCHNNRKTGDYHCHRSQSPPRAAPPASEKGVVKKSRSGICHAPGTTYYSRTTNFVAYETIGACVKAGGRLPQR